MNLRSWAVVANRSGAYFFELDNGKSANLFETLPNPRGRLTNGELNSDRPGRMKDRFGRVKHSMMRSHSPKEQISIDFAKEIGRFIEKARARGKFNKLFLIAPSKLLGEMKFSLKPLTRKLIEESFHKVLREDNMESKLIKLIFGKSATQRKREERIYA